jgi:hypothetical protein
MTNYLFESPSIAEIIHLSVELVPVEGTGVVSVRAYADDGDTVTLTWDVIARSFTIWWRRSGVERLRIERELATQISIRDDHGAVELECWSRGSDFGGHLLVRVADHVSASDAILRM